MGIEEYGMVTEHGMTGYPAALISSRDYSSSNQVLAGNALFPNPFFKIALVKMPELIWKQYPPSRRGERNPSVTRS
jgi:hypothetical protein